jgi:hypothetical protein
MFTDADIASMRTTLQHAANHLDEVRQDLTDPYHAGEQAPAAVLQQLVPTLNAIERYGQELRTALITMAQGGLTDDEDGDWYAGDAGPFDTLGEALAFKAADELDEFVTQDHDRDDDRTEADHAR